MSKICFALLFFSMLATSAFAQIALTAVPFLEMRPDAHTTANGGVFTALESDDINAFVYNPAQLGNFGKYNNLSFQTDPGRTNWLTNLGSSDLTLFNTSIAAGYNFRKIPLSFGMAFSNHQLDLGTSYNTITQENYTGKEEYDMYSIGVRYDFGIRINAGFSYKDINSDLGMYQAEADAYDFGVQVGYPFTYNNLFGELSIGYSLLNSGDFIQYAPELRPDPLPKKSVVGYAISLGYQTVFRDNYLKIASVDWSVEAENLLIDWNGTSTSYSSQLEILPVLDNLLTTRSNDETLVKHGLRLHIMESATVSFGKFYGPGFPEPISTRGVSLSLQSISKVFLSSLKHPIFTYFRNHFDVTYSWASYHTEDQSHPLNGTSLNRISFTINGF